MTAATKTFASEFSKELLTAPSSPRWNDPDCDYPNVEGASDFETCQDWRDDIDEHTIALRKCCECAFGDCAFTIGPIPTRKAIDADAANKTDNFL